MIEPVYTQTFVLPSLFPSTQKDEHTHVTEDEHIDETRLFEEI